MSMHIGAPCEPLVKKGDTVKSTYIESADASYAKIFSKEENEGYTKTVQTEGNFVFTIFTPSK